MKDGRNIVGELSSEERAIIEKEYGPQKCFGSAARSKEQLASIHELTEKEMEFFGQDDSDSANLSVQMLYKFHGTFVPVRFTKELQSFVQDNPMLRSAYCPMEERVVRVVFQETQPAADIVYRNLMGQPSAKIDGDIYNYMGADMRQTFDITRGPLFRFAVFHTGKDEYAIILTILGVLRDYMDISGLLAEMDPKAAAARKTAPKAKTAAEPKVQITDEGRRYWAQLLAGLPSSPKIPYCAESGQPFSQKAYRLPGLEAYEDLLAKKSGGNTELFISILQTAWGLYLQHVNHSWDVCCCVLTPMGKNKSGNQTMIPIRLQANPAFTVGATVENLYEQFLASQPYGSEDRKVMDALIGGQRKLFNHFLSFGEFGGYAQASSDGAVMENVWDMRGLPLGVYFHFLPSGITATFLYDEGSFPPGGVERLAWEFTMTLHQVLTLWGSTLAEFHEKLEEGLSGSERAVSGKEEPVEKFLAGIPFFDGVDKEILRRLAARAEQSVRYEGDYIMSLGAKRMVYFLAEGQVARLMDSGSGWLNMLDVALDGAWINDTVLLPKCKSKSAAEVISEEARIVAVPVDDFEAVLCAEPKIMRCFLLHALKEMEKYERRWAET